MNYTNAAVLLTEDFADTEDLDGVFSGLDREQRNYDYDAWRYQGGDMSAAAGRATGQLPTGPATPPAARARRTARAAPTRPRPRTGTRPCSIRAACSRY